jgi:hypothetical protein
MTEQEFSSPEMLTHNRPEFDAGFVTINYFSTEPEGFSVQTRESLDRRDHAAGRSYPTSLALSQEQRDELRRGMASEVYFTLPRDLPADKKNDIKTMFALIDEVTTLKRNDVVDANYHDKLYQLQTLRRELHPILQQYNLTEQLGVKVGVRNVQREGNTLTIDVRPISYPVYAVASSPEDSAETLDLGAVTGTAAILITADNKIILQHRSAKNSPYGDMPGASFAGMVDAEWLRETDPQTGEITKRTGKIKPVTDEDVKKSSATERQQEIALTDDDITDFRIVGEARDHVREHDEFLLLAKTGLTAQEVAQKAKDAPRSRNPKKLDDHGDFHFEENFITIEATPEAIETLLTEVKCPLPPTHAAAFVAAGYNLVLEQRGQEAANAWREKMQTEVKKNYEEMNEMVADYYQKNPTELTNNKPGKPKRNPQKYEPYYTPQEQGLPSLGSELIRTGLISSTMPS